MKNTKMTGKQITFWDYLVGSGNYTLGKIDKSKPHAIMYIHGKTAYEWSVEKAVWELTATGSYWALIKLGVSWLAGWEDAAKWDAHWAITQYDEESLKKLQCEVIEQ